MTRRATDVVAWVALAIGVIVYLLLPLGPAGEHSRTPKWRWLVAVAAALLALVPPVSARINRLLDRIREPNARQRAIASLAIACVAAVYLYATAVAQDRDFFPKTHDECSYAIQVRQLAIGRLWMPQHPLADFFDSFYLIVRPVYSSMYFPGTAMMNVPGAWLGLPTWVVPLIIAAACVGLAYRVVTELSDGVIGALVAVTLLSLTWFRTHSIVMMSQLPTLLLGLLMTWGWLRSRQASTQRRWGAWVLLIGAMAGWAAITRPVDAVCFAVPVGVALLSGICKEPRRVGAAVALLIAGAVPFLIVQLFFNHGVTGQWLRTPFDLYASQNYPGTSYGFHAYDPSFVVQSVIPQKRALYETWAKPYILRHQPGQILGDWWTHRLPLMADVTTPARPLIALIPVGLLALWRRSWVLIAPLGLFIALYVGYTFFLEHYALLVAPVVGALVIGGAFRLVGRSAAGRAGFILMFLAFAATGTWELNHWDAAHGVSDEPFRSQLLRGLHDLNQPDSIVLFADDVDPTGEAVMQEPVYNVDVAWPDKASMIRAHDLGPERDLELFRYYAQVSPNRAVYRFDRRTGQVQELGRVGDLGKSAGR